jgi:hypothetical protein
MSMSMDDAGDLQKTGFGEKEPHWDEKIKWFQVPADNEPHSYRLLATPVYYSVHWIQARKKDGTQGKSFPVLCKNYDSTKSKYFENGCKVCDFTTRAYNVVRDLAKGKPPLKDANGKVIQPAPPENIKKMGRRITMATNAIVRELQAQGAPSNNSANWSYIAPLRFPQGFSDKILDSQSKFGVKKTGNDGVGVYGFNHRHHGKDLVITFNPDAKSPGEMYQLAMGQHDPVTALTEEELTQTPNLTNFLEHLKDKYPKDSAIEDTLQRYGYYEWLDQQTAALNVKQIERTAPSQQQDPAQPAQGSTAPANTAFDDAGGFAYQGEQRREQDNSPSSPKMIGNMVVPPAEDDIDESQMIGAPKPKAPAQPAQPQAQPAQTPAPATQAAAQAEVEKPQAATGSDIGTRIHTFASESDKTLVALQTAFDVDLKFYKPGMTGPDCFSKYSANDKVVCKKCPLRLDCMMTDN